MDKLIKKNSLFNILYNIANLLFPLITSVYASRIILAEGIGKVAYAQNIASYFVTFSCLGLPTYGVREIAKVGEDKDKRNKLFTELILINGMFTTIATICFVFLVFCIPRFRNDIVLFMCCGIQVLMNFFQIDWLFRGIEKYKYITIRSIVVKGILLVSVLAFVRTKDDYVIYALCASLAVTLNYFFNVIQARKFVSFNFVKLELRKHFAPLVVLALSVFLSAAYSKVDITMLGSMNSNVATGLYSNAHKIIEIIITVCTSISAVFLPRLSYYYSHDRKAFKELIYMGMKILAFITFPAAIGLFVMAPEIVELFYGNSFYDAIVTIRIFTLLIVVKSFGDLLCYQLVIATGNERRRLPAYFLAAVLNIIINACLIPRMAQNGAAIASVISELIVNSIQLYFMQKLLHLHYPVRDILQGVGSSLIMGGVVYFVCIAVIPWIYLRVALGLVIGIMTYILLNLAIKNEMAIKGLAIFKRRRGVGQ